MKALILTLATLLPLAAQDAPKEAPRPGHRGEHFAQALQLTADQKTKIQALRASQRTAMAPKRQAAQDARMALAKALQDPTTPEATLRDLHQKASEAHFQVMLAGRANLTQVRTLLTPEQQEKAKVLWASHREKVQGRMRRMWMAAQD